MERGREHKTTCTSGYKKQLKEGGGRGGREEEGGGRGKGRVGETSTFFPRVAMISLLFLATSAESTSTSVLPNILFFFSCSARGAGGGGGGKWRPALSY